VPFVQGVTDQYPNIHKLNDILSTHPYMQGLREILAKGGADQTTIWYTELGFPLTQAAHQRW